MGTHLFLSLCKSLDNFKRIWFNLIILCLEFIYLLPKQQALLNAISVASDLGLHYMLKHLVKNNRHYGLKARFCSIKRKIFPLRVALFKPGDTYF